MTYKDLRMILDGPNKGADFLNSRGELPEVSIVIPCLNEEMSIELCVRRAFEIFHHYACEVIVVDNGSHDQSAQRARDAGARVVIEPKRGYGAALKKGLGESRSFFILISDADNTYDFQDGLRLVEYLKSGADLVVGNRLSGRMERGSMPWLHQYLGTPVLTFLSNRFFNIRLGDINCGLRAIRRSCLQGLNLSTSGMEFASEMIIKARRAGLRIEQAPVKYLRREFGVPKLRTFRDGWRHLRFILMSAWIHR